MTIERKKYKGDPVFSENGKWYFHDESWAYIHGPYDTESQCDKALRKYGLELLR